MLLELNIENFIIIKKLNILLSKGFNVFTGETGAGKSIIIDAMNVVLGGRATKDYIKSGSEKSRIEALFQINDSAKIDDIFGQFGIEKEIDNTILITREIHITGKSVSRINGRTVTLSMLNKITNNLVDIHGQHEHQSLLNWENHVNYIDMLGGKRILELKDKNNYIYNKYMEQKKKLNRLSIDDMERERKIDLLKFQLNEIDSASLKIDEEENLMNEYRKLSNTQEILVKLSSINEKLDTDYQNQFSIIDQLSNISQSLQKIATYDTNLESYVVSINSVLYQLQDIEIDLKNYVDTIDYDKEKLQFIEDRIDLINKLERKYGSNIKTIVKYRNTIIKELELLTNNEKEIIELEKNIEKELRKLTEVSSLLTEERKKAGNMLRSKLINELKDMNLNDVRFNVKYDKLKVHTKNGQDKVEFLISTNPGEPLKSLSKVISGGEMSRIMLAFKNILANIDEIPCLIFDEIDTGISGRTAQLVAGKMVNISKTHQVLCITHLPQIASMASSHFLITKEIILKETLTKVKKLDFNERINELSRLLGGVNLTETTKKHAKEMLEMAKISIN